MKSVHRETSWARQNSHFSCSIFISKSSDKLAYHMSLKTAYWALGPSRYIFLVFKGLSMRFTLADLVCRDNVVSTCFIYEIVC